MAPIAFRGARSRARRITLELTKLGKARINVIAIGTDLINTLMNTKMRKSGNRHDNFALTMKTLIS